MRPLRATFHYTVDVEADPANPDHANFLAIGIYPEKRMSHGYITDILELTDTESVRALNGLKDVNGKQMPEYKDMLGTRSGVYVIFWEDLGDSYKMHVEDYNSFTVTKREMEGYVREQRTI